MKRKQMGDDFVVAVATYSAPLKIRWTDMNEPTMWTSVAPVVTLPDEEI